ncbi:DUF3880 domain-containing protein [Neobacillus mesonae]|nr:DUF3880 domain-containing protein [Neobacillus mesonae]
MNQKLQGFNDGYEEGVRYGGCESILSRIENELPLYWDLKVMYVPQGFDAIDEGIVAALALCARECIVADRKHMAEMADEHHPDLMLVLNGLHIFPDDHLAQVKQIRSKGILTAIWFVDDPYFTEDTAEICLHYNLVFTHEMHAVPFYKALGADKVYYLPLGADPLLYKPRKISPDYRYDICFIGTGFWNRIELFDELAPYLKNKRVMIAGGQWERLSRLKLIRPFIRPGWIPPQESVNYYNGAKIVINMHRPTTPGMDNRNTHNITGGSINPRTYEINACGTLQLTDVREDLTLYYRPGYDIETFHTAQELQEKMDYYLYHEEERLAISWRGLMTTSQYHTMRHRIEMLLSYI